METKEDLINSLKTPNALQSVPINYASSNEDNDFDNLITDTDAEHTARQVVRRSWMGNFIIPGRTKHDPTVSKLKSLLYLPNGDVKYKVRFDTDYTDLPTRIKKYSSTSEPEPLHYGPLPISASKWKHLQELKKELPSDYHFFYDNLNY